MCEYAEVYKTVFRVARKIHECQECDVQINSGEKYCYSSGIFFDGSPFSYKYCIDCSELLDFVWGLPETECIDVPLYEYLADCEYIDSQPHDEDFEYGAYCTITSAVPWLMCVGGRWKLNKSGVSA